MRHLLMESFPWLSRLAPTVRSFFPARKIVRKRKISLKNKRRKRISLPKNRMLKENKDAIRHALNVFEKERKYDGHIVVNVDPA